MMKLPIVLTLTILALTSCIAEQAQMAGDEFDARPDVTQRAVEPGQYVLLYRDALFLERPDDPDRSHRAFAPARDEASAPFTQHFLAEVVADLGDWVKVKRLPLAEDTICNSRRFHSREVVDLYFYVSRDDLSLTVREPLSYRYDDGTGADLLPGVPLEPTENSRDEYRTWSGDVNFVIDVPSQKVGHGFSPVETWDPSSYSGTPVESDTKLVLGDTPVKTMPRESPFAVDLIEERGDRYLVAIERECARLVVSVEVEAVNMSSRVGGGSYSAGIGCGGARGNMSSYYIAHPGTPVYWPEGGEEAGEMTESVRLYPDAQGDISHELCRQTRPFVWDDAALPDEAQEVEYCLEYDDLEYVPAAPDTVVH